MIKFNKSLLSKLRARLWLPHCKDEGTRILLKSNWEDK